MANTEPKIETGADVFAHPNNITRGKGRVMWGTEIDDPTRPYQPAGWVLPGGKRTQSRDVAEAVADRINQLSH